MKVFILTYCTSPESLYGNLLTFKTVRVGFPDADIYVVDNGSIVAARSELRREARRCDAKYTQIDPAINHHDFLEQVVMAQNTTGTVAFVDPDICFWENVEVWELECLMAGRRIPMYDCEVTQCMTYARLHTSFLWIPDVSRLREAILEVIAGHFDFQPFLPWMHKENGLWRRFDTGASLYAALTNQLYAFTERELDVYDHLFCGTHLGRISPLLGDEARARFEKLHEEARRDYKTLRGAWRLQEDYFQSRAVAALA